MLEIEEYIINILSSDTILAGYLGANSTVKRIYSWYPPMTISYSSTLKSAIFYKNSQNRRDLDFSYPSQEGSIIFTFQIVSINRNLIPQIEDQLKTLLHDSSIDITNWKVLNIVHAGSEYLENLGTPTYPLYVKNVLFNFDNVLKKGG